jgi:hypothetical protein
MLWRKQKKMKLKNKLKKYFLEKPKQDFWFWAFITLFLFRYVSPLALFMLVPFQIGLIAPHTPIDYNSMAENLTNAFIPLIKIMHTTGQKFAIQNPILSKIIFYALANVIWVFWLGVIGLLINLARYGVGWIYRRNMKGGIKNDKEKIKRN